MDQTVIGIIMMIGGIIMVVFRRRLVQFRTATQKEALNVSLSEKAIKANEWITAFGGLVFLVLGILTLLDIMKWHG